MSPRFTQRLVRIGRRRYWSAPLDVDLTQHIDEHTLVTGSADEFEAFCAHLATRQLPRDRPLWAVTLVHGLAGGLQAAVLRVHHGIMDGLASVNLLKALTTAEPGVAASPAVAAHQPATNRLPLVTRLDALARAGLESRRRTKSFGPARRVPRGPGARTVFNQPSGADRLCASHDVAFDDLKLLSIASGSTLNGALHTVVAHAMREEMLDRGAVTRQPLIATFGVVEDGTSTRCHGNDIATARVWLHAEQTDDRQLIDLTTASCTESVALRRHRGFALQQKAMDVVDRLAPAVRVLASDHTPLVTNHITTANVLGPASERWFGDVRVVGLTSYSLAIAPADVSLTAYSYAGRIWFGLVTTPESMPDPKGFLHRLDVALAELLAAVQPVSTPQPTRSGRESTPSLPPPQSVSAVAGSDRTFHLVPKIS